MRRGPVARSSISGLSKHFLYIGDQMEKNQKLAIVVLNWNSSSATLCCLAHLSSWSDLKAEVIVVDNGSSEEDIARLRQPGLQFHLVCNHANLGYAGGNNRGIQVALEEGFPFIMLLNSDATINERCVVNLLGYLENRQEIGVIGPLLEEHGTVYSGGRNIGLYSNTRIKQPTDNGEPGLFNVDYVPGTVLLARAGTLKSVGLLEEDYFFSGEVADFCQRVHNAGLRCTVFAGCRAIHDTDTHSTVRDSLYNYYSLRNRFLFIRRYFPFARYLLFLRWVAGGTLQIILAFLTGRHGRTHALWMGLKDGVAGRFGDRNDLFLR
jgi:GT2 family glycosyltransferase